MKLAFLLITVSYLLFGCEGKSSVQNNQGESTLDTSTTLSLLPESQNTTEINTSDKFNITDFIKGKTRVDTNTFLLGVNKRNDSILIVEEHYEGFACDGPSYTVSLISSNSLKSKLLFHYKCSPENTWDSLFNQKDTLRRILDKGFYFPGSYYSHDIVSPTELIETFKVDGKISYNEWEGVRLVSSFTLVLDNTVAYSYTFNEDDFIQELKIVDALYFKRSEAILIRIKKSALPEMGDPGYIYCITKPN